MAHRYLSAIRCMLLQHFLRQHNMCCAQCHAPLPHVQKNTLFVIELAETRTLRVYCDLDCLDMTNLENEQETFYNVRDKTVQCGKGAPQSMHVMYLRSSSRV